MASRAVTEELLLRGTDDWLPLSEVAWVVRSVGGVEPDEAVRQETLSVVDEMLRAGLIDVGDLTEAGFESWNLSPRAALEELRRRWDALGGMPRLGDVSWFANTPSGDAAAERLSARPSSGPVCQD